MTWDMRSNSQRLKAISSLVLETPLLIELSC